MKAKGSVLMSLGLVLMLAAGALTVYNIQDSERAGVASETVMQTLEEIIEPIETVPPEVQTQVPEVELPDYVRFPNLEMPVITVDGRDYVGYLSIPALELELPILSQWSNSGARIAPCRYSGSVYLDDMVIAGHNYVKHFHDLSDLKQGDEIIFTDAEGNQFYYTVQSIELLPPTAVEDMVVNDWDLTLFTCTYSKANRVTIRCERV